MSTGFPYCPDRKIHRLVREHCAATGVTLGSMLDIGCGRTRGDAWFATAPVATSPRAYVGLDMDPEIRGELKALGLDVRDPFAADGQASSGDLCTALEVIEHIPPAETVAFLREYLRRTRKLFVLTTPNGEYWDGRWPRDENEDLHWIPDHFLDLVPLVGIAAQAHSHTQLFTPVSLAESLAAALPDPSWRYAVYRAWPWTITDETRPTTYRVYYKLFALAWPTTPGS